MLYDCERCDRSTNELLYIAENKDAICKECYMKETGYIKYFETNSAKYKVMGKQYETIRAN